MVEIRNAVAARRREWAGAPAMSERVETLATLLEKAAVETPTRLLVQDAGRQVDCATLHAEARALATAMLERAPTGSVVSFMLPNWHEAATIYLAATIAGMIAHPILPSLREHDLKFALQDSNSRFIFIPQSFRGFDYAGMLQSAVEAIPNPPHVVVVRGDAHIPFQSLLTGSQSGPFPQVDPHDVRMLMYTSGTTGRPKGVLHSHSSLDALVRQIGQHWLVAPGDSFLVASPISHIGGSIYAFECPLILGSVALLMERWDADEAVARASQERWTHMAGATPFLEQVLSAARKADTRLPDLKVFICGGAAVPPSLIREAAGYFAKARVSRVYGSTEVPVASVGSLGADDLEWAADTDGRAGIAEIHIAAHPTAPAGEGEVRLRGAQMLTGYLHPEDEAGAFDEDGFFRSGDLGKLVNGDRLVITGRAKDIIIRNGENIAPKEIEDLLIHHPGIAEISIVGIPDSRTGERAVAAIVPEGNALPDVEALKAFLDARGVARFKFPEQVSLRESLPRNDAGKVLKDRLKADILAEGDNPAEPKRA